MGISRQSKGLPKVAADEILLGKCHVIRKRYLLIEIMFKRNEKKNLLFFLKKFVFLVKIFVENISTTLSRI